MHLSLDKLTRLVELELDRKVRILAVRGERLKKYGLFSCFRNLAFAAQLRETNFSVFRDFADDRTRDIVHFFDFVVIAFGRFRAGRSQTDKNRQSRDIS
jgi:hypothetical protein